MSHIQRLVGARFGYPWWQAQDRKVLRRVNALLLDIQRHGNEGIGKPEALKHDFAGYWSRRITDEHRLVHKLVGDEIRIAACRYHYGSATCPRHLGWTSTAARSAV